MKRIAWVALLAAFALGPVKGAENAREFTDWSPAVNLGPAINGPFGDSCVAISKDGLSLFFSSNRQSPGTTNRDLYVSTRQSVDDPWELPIPLTMLNSSVWDSCPALSPDEHRLYFTTQRPPSCGQDDIWVSRRQDRRDNLGWEPPESLGCEDDGFLNGPGRDLTPTIFEGAAGAETMYFARTEGVDVYKSDHYESVMGPDGTFGVPVPIHELNSAYAELGITVRRDGLEAFLLSTRPGGSGVTTLWDFWRATRASTRDSWSVPAFVPSLGNPALASGRIDLSFDGSELYFTSQRGGGFGMADLWVARREQVRGPKTSISGTMNIVSLGPPVRVLRTPSGTVHTFHLPEHSRWTGDIEGTVTFDATATWAQERTHLIARGPFDGEVTFRGRAGRITGQWTTNCKWDSSLGRVSCDGVMNARGTGELDGAQFHIEWGPGWWPFPYSGTASSPW